MLILMFRTAENLYAFDAVRVAEVVPRVAVRPIPHAPAYLAGLLSYRGQAVPAVDFGVLIGTNPSRDALSTRVILTEFTGHDGATRLIGVIAEDVSHLKTVEAGQVVAGLHPAGVGGRAGVAQQQRPGIPVGHGLGLGRRVVDGSVGTQADVAVRVDQAGQHPAGHGGDVVVAGGGGIRDAPADHPGLRAHVVGADEDGTGEVQHLSHAQTLAGPPRPASVPAPGRADPTAVLARSSSFSRAPRSG